MNTSLVHGARDDGFAAFLSVNLFAWKLLVDNQCNATVIIGWKEEV